VIVSNLEFMESSHDLDSKILDHTIKTEALKKIQDTGLRTFEKKKGLDNDDCSRYFFQKGNIKTTGETGQLLEQTIWGI